MGGILSCQKECSGKGECIKVIGHNNFTINKKFFCINDCEPIPCPNFVVCGTILPEHLLQDAKYNTCPHCEKTFGRHVGGHGILGQKMIEECGICYSEDVLGITNPKCTHFICIECFTACYASVLPRHIKGRPPAFPYGRDIQIRYAQDPLSPEWFDYPEIANWICEMDYWNSKVINPELAKCAFCRL